MSGAFRQSLAHLLPTGYAWPRDPVSTLMAVLNGTADVFQEHHDFANQAVAEWQPHSTHTRLEEWEEACGLPDPCFGPNQSYEDRRARLLARLQGPTGAYDDSSPAALGALVAVVASMGFIAEAHYNTRFRCGRDRVSSRLGTNDGRLYLFVTVDQMPLRVGMRVGARLIEQPPQLSEMVCALDAYVPARFELNVIFRSS